MKARMESDGEEIKQKGTPLVQLEQTESIKKEPCGSEINSFIEVDEAIKMESNDATASPRSTIIPYHDLEKYTTISMPIL